MSNPLCPDTRWDHDPAECPYCDQKPVVDKKYVKSLTTFAQRDYLPMRRTDPSTSKEAAKSIDLTKREALVFKAFEDAGCDMTNEELIDFMDEEQTGNVSSRVTSLRRKGFLRRNGKERKSRQGRMQKVNEWVPEALREDARQQFLQEELADEGE